jgi:glycosyltransferase involved in cell wall biosynthesis
MEVCFIAPLAANHPGALPSQGEILYRLFRAEAADVLAASDKLNRYHRLIHMAGFLVKHRRRIKIQCLSVYSGPSFVLADILSTLGRALGQKLVLHLHGGGLPDLFGRRPDWSRRVLRRADAIVAPSPFLARAAKSMGFDCQVIPNVIQLDHYPFRHRSTIQPRLFWMRSFHPIWNPEMAVKVLARLRDHGTPATLIMGGNDKGSLPEVRALAKQLQVEPALRFAGFLDQAGKTREGDAADIFLNTNRMDNMPVSVVEAGAMGLPVVSTNVGGIPDLLTDGETGLLVPSDDVEAMADAVGRLVADPGLVSKLSANARKLAEKSAWLAVKAQWMALFRQLEFQESAR